jgi:rare lipoprotein A
MVRAMTRSLTSKLRTWSRPTMVLAVGVLVAGCASGPSRDAAPVSRGGGGGKPAAPVASSGRDGAPGDAPRDLASLPDPVPRIEPIKPGGPNKPYEVLGQSYSPVAADVAWKERGLASWYGTKFHGRKTASGELFSMYGLTAAHKTLPIPSYARVRNLSTGKEIIVRVNDRGPFHSSRVMDLSYAAAVKLGIMSVGSAQVEIERLTFDDIRTGAWKRDEVPGLEPVQPTQEASNAPAQDDPILAMINSRPVVNTPTPAVTPVAATSVSQARAYTTAAQGFWVQLAALSKREGVDRLQQRVAAELSGLVPMLAVFQESALYRLQVGPYGSRQEAQAAAEQARDTLQLTPMVFERR